MEKLRKGDIVARLSYNKDILFEITNVMKLSEDNGIYILKGITKRLEADSYKEDLEKIDKRLVNLKLKKLDSKIYNYVEKHLQCSIYNEKTTKNKRINRVVYTGKILHLDGDKRYSEKSIKYYKNLGLNAVVKNVTENKQAVVVKDLLNKYQPDILILTGHDGMIKKGTDYYNIYNYRTSRYFVNTVREAKKWSSKNKDLAIFAGACQSFYEAIINEGANFASSPARIMIDFIDPLIVAEKIATTESTRYISINDIKDELRDGDKGISGIGSIGKKKIN